MKKRAKRCKMKFVFFSLFSVVSLMPLLNALNFFVPSDEGNYNQIESHHREHEHLNILLNNQNEAFNWNETRLMYESESVHDVFAVNIAYCHTSIEPHIPSHCIETRMCVLSRSAVDIYVCLWLIKFCLPHV